MVAYATIYNMMSYDDVVEKMEKKHTRPPHVAASGVVYTYSAEIECHTASCTLY
jgi:hypothetical protein